MSERKLPFGEFPGQLAAANKRLLTEVFPAAFKKDQLEMTRAAVVIDVELAVSAESTEGAVFHESDFKDQALPEVARLIAGWSTLVQLRQRRTIQQGSDRIN